MKRVRKALMFLIDGSGSIGSAVFRNEVGSGPESPDTESRPKSL